MSSKPLNQPSLSFYSCIESIEQKAPHLIGYAYGILANLCFSLLNATLRKARSIPHFQIYYLRAISLALVMFYINRKQNQQLVVKSTRINIFLLIVGTLGLIGGSCIFYGFQTVPLNEASVLNQTTPVFVGIFAAIFMGEAYDMIQFFSMLFCTIGVVLIAKPIFLFDRKIVEEDEDQRTKGIMSLLFAAFTMGIQSLFIKKIVSNVSPNLSVFYIGLIPALFGPFLMLTEGVSNLSLYEWVSCLNVMLFGFLAQLLQNRAYRFGDTGKIAMMGYAQIIFGYALDVYVLGTTPDFYSVIGSAFIFCCVFLRIYRTWKEGKTK